MCDPTATPTVGPTPADAADVRVCAEAEKREREAIFKS